MTKTELHGVVASLAEEILGNRMPYHIVVEEGHPVQVVITRLARHMPDLIVMGCHGHDGMARVLLGSIAENVVRVARCPMLIVKGTEPADTRLKLIRCPVDFGESAADSLQVAAVLAAIMRAKLEVGTAADKAEITGPTTEERLHAWVPEGLRRLVFSSGSQAGKSPRPCGSGSIVGKVVSRSLGLG